MYSITALSVLAYVWWTSNFSSVQIIISGAVQKTLEFFIGSSGSTNAGSAVSSTTDSLQTIGVSLPVFYFKLFFVSTLLVVLTVIVVAWAFLDRFNSKESSSERASLIRYLGLGLVGVSPIFFIYFLGDIGAYYFRQASFMMMVGTIVSSAGMAYLYQNRSQVRNRRKLSIVLIISFLIVSPLSMMVIYNSPYIHRANQHVTEQKVDAYETTFLEMNDTGLVASLREEPQRYFEATVSMRETGRLDASVNSTTISQLTEQHDRVWYLVLSRNAYEREILAYEEIRYTRSDITAPERQPGVDRIYSNGDTSVYHIESSETADERTARNALGKRQDQLSFHAQEKETGLQTVNQRPVERSAIGGEGRVDG